MKADRLPLVMLAGPVLSLSTALAVFLLRGRPGRDPVLTVETAEVEPPASPTSLATPRGPADARALPARQAVADDAPSAGAPVPVPVAPALPELTVSGELVLVEPDGRERRDLDGRLGLLPWIGGEPVGHMEVAVVESRWTATLVARAGGGYSQESRRRARFPADVAGASIGALAPLLARDECPPVLVDPEQRFSFGDSDVVVRIRCAPAVTLIVEDADTGASLDRVTVLEARGWRTMEWNHPGNGEDARQLVERASSPLALTLPAGDRTPGLRTCFVHSPGYAWTAIQLDFARGGERALRLERGGDVEVILASTVNLDDVQLRLRAPERGSIPICEVPLEQSDGLAPVVLEGLPAGELSLVAERGSWQEPTELGRCDVRVVPGERVRATLVVQRAPQVQMAPLSGRLILPPEWGIEPSIRLDLLDAVLDGARGDRSLGPRSLPPVEGSPGTYSFDLGMSQVGRYALLFEPLAFGMKFELGPQGLNDLVFEVPPPVELEVHVVDATTGTTADIRTLRWNATFARGVPSLSFQAVNREAGSDRFRIRVPSGKVGLWVWDSAYARFSEQVDTRDGSMVVLELRPSSSVLIRMADGDTPIPWPLSDFEAAEPLEASGRIDSWGISGGVFRLHVSEPGRYRVTVPDVPGYEPHLPLDVEAIEGQTVEVIVQRVRLP